MDFMKRNEISVLVWGALLASPGYVNLLLDILWPVNTGCSKRIKLKCTHEDV
jgi:hypothetical protein